ncbi:MAG TPA: ATP-binding protein [Syntrophobacteraceae bacterium]|nr:ATP-binding protein [Syntrophobacteraceae bacterium]
MRPAESDSFDNGGIPLGDPLREQRELQILFDITSALHASPVLKEVLQRALMAILRTLRFKMGAIYLFKEGLDEHGLLELAAHHGFSSSLVECIRSFSLTHEVLDPGKRPQPVRWFPVSKLIFPRLRERMIEERVTEIICIPLMTQKRVLGLLYVTNDGVLPLKPDRNEFLTTIGHQLGVAIDNAQLFDSVQRAKSELEISFDAIQHSIFVIDERWRIVRVNRTCEEVYGGSRNLIGKKYSSVLYGTEEPPRDCPILMCLRTHERIQREGAHFRWGGYYHYFASPVINLEGVLERVVYYEKDATEARKLEQRLQQSEKLKALGTLAAGVAHEIRNPLATINFNAQMLRREIRLDSAQEQMFGDMVHEIRKIDRIVQQVLHFARPKEPQFLPNQLNDIVRYCYDLSKVYLRKAHVEISLRLAEVLPSLVMDHNQISQVIMNLVINAIEAMPQGGKLFLNTGRRDDPPALTLEIRDTGHGILEEDRSRIFDPFFTRKPEGTGLGLSISRQILEKHGAEIEVESVPGEGTVFRIIFPWSLVDGSGVKGFSKTPPLAPVP